MRLSGRMQTRPRRRERKIAKRARRARALPHHGPLQPMVSATLTTELENPPFQKYGRNARHTEKEQEYRELLGQRVPGLRNAHPQVGS